MLLFFFFQGLISQWFSFANAGILLSCPSFFLVEFATLELVDGKVVRTILNQADIEALLKENKLLTKTDEAK